MKNFSKILETAGKVAAVILITEAFAVTFSALAYVVINIWKDMLN